MIQSFSKGENSPLKAPFSSGTPNKFLQHFQSINTPTKTQFISKKPHSNKYKESNIKNYTSIMEDYHKNNKSIIDKIVDEPVVNVVGTLANETSEHYNIVKKPMMVNLDPNIKYRVERINSFFSGNQFTKNNKNKKDKHNLQNYINQVMKIQVDLKNPELGSRSRSASHSHSLERDSIINKNQQKIQKSSQIHSTPPKYKPNTLNNNSHVYMKTRQQGEQVQNFDRVENKDNQIVQPLNRSAESSPYKNQIPTQRTPQKWRKMDLLIMEIMRQKRRKGIVSDYYRAIEMKLVELLEYILHDEPDYYGLALVDKMKKVLKNLENFKGRTIDGESKINMLKIFFEEYRSLKREHEQQFSEDGGKSKISNDEQQFQGQTKIKPLSNNLKIKKTFESSPVVPLSYSKKKKASDTLSVGAKNSNVSKNIKNVKNRKQGVKSVMEDDIWMGSLS